MNDQNIERKTNLPKLIMIIIAIVVCVALVLVVRKIYINRIITKIAETNIFSSNNYCLTVTNENVVNDAAKMHKISYKDGIAKEELEFSQNYYFFYKGKDNEFLVIYPNEKQYKTSKRDRNYSIVYMSELLTNNAQPANELVKSINSKKIIFKTETYNGKKYYTLKNEYSKVWIDKSNFMVVREELYVDNKLFTVYNYKLELNSITDNDISKPDLTGYTEKVEN